MEKMLMLKKKMNKARPRFVRQEGTSKRMLQKVGWRKPKGYHSKIRRKFKGHRAMPNVGYRSPSLVRGLNMHGLKPVVVRNLAEAAALVAKNDAAVISNVGKKLKVEMIRELLKAKVKILNVLNPEKFVSDVEAEIKRRQDEKKAKEDRKKKSKEESLKKAAEKKKEEEAKTEEEKKKEKEEEQRKVLERPQ